MKKCVIFFTLLILALLLAVLTENMERSVVVDEVVLAGNSVDHRLAEEQTEIAELSPE
ncbi:hypothetical protein [uncultured Eudoraea sp.]|uniref:hypothetical protein n=1 Tax=uncultured Eudoraea sp. TaxID=1035614 RepID=UPI0026193FEA|nr:hypothetical protein [uncultured Eudoraea sp.]